MINKVAEEMTILWRAAEAMHWQLGEADMARRAGVVPFSQVTSNSTSHGEFHSRIQEAAKLSSSEDFVGKYHGSTFEPTAPHNLSKTVVPGFPRPKQVPYPSTEVIINPDGLCSQSPPAVSPTEEPSLYINAKQLHRILKRRVARQRLEEALRLAPKRKPYLHESRHGQCRRRPRAPSGRFLTADEISEAERIKNESKDPSSPHNSTKSDFRQVIGEKGMTEPNDPVS